ncbi:hypothetical protein [Halosimplex salinum]|uniref:hypothetical protein n=1 Tax=Halosimplex salinum TaxID=1710538 RepID=UPI0013DDCA2F|nr:hypothetical protein [Halosimplex salinum]
MRDTIQDTDTQEQDEFATDRYLTTQYGDRGEEITLLHDTENEHAWIQSDHAVDVSQ